MKSFKFYFFVIAATVWSIATTATLAMSDSCASLSPRECYEENLDRCILDKQEGAYYCRTPKPPCEANWKYPGDSYSDRALIKKLRSECEAKSSQCQFQEPSC